MAAKPALALPGQQINYGSGKEVSDETIADAGEPMEIRWLGGGLSRAAAGESVAPRPRTDGETRPPFTCAETPVKPTTLTVASLLSIILLPFHIGGDVALGFDRGGSGFVFVVVPILLLLACGTLLLAERRSGHVIMFLGGLAALGMPIIHRNNGFTATVARSPGGLFFIWTLVALGVTGGLAIILSARGLWRLRSRRA